MRTTVNTLLLFSLYAFALIAAGPGSAAAHAIDHRVVGSDAKMVEVFYADGRPFEFEEFEVSGPGDRSPFAIGRTDRLGRVVFAPDRPGEWTVKVWSEDGHGVTTMVNVEASPGRGLSAPRPKSSTADTGRRRMVGLAIGLGVIATLGLSLILQTKGKRS